MPLLTRFQASFPNVQNLALRIYPYPHDDSHILPSICVRFPRVSSVSLHFFENSVPVDIHRYGYNIFDYPPRTSYQPDIPLPTFERLHSLHIVHHTPYIYDCHEPSLGAITGFLVRHAATLRHLTLPKIQPKVNNAVDLSSVELHSLTTSLAFAHYLSAPGSLVHLGARLEDLEELSINSILKTPWIPVAPFSPHDEPEIVKDYASGPDWAFRATKSLTLCPVAEDVMLDYQDIACFFPDLVHLTLNLRRIVSITLYTLLRVGTHHPPIIDAL